MKYNVEGEFWEIINHCKANNLEPAGIIAEAIFQRSPGGNELVELYNKYIDLFNLWDLWEPDPIHGPFLIFPGS